MGRRPYRTTCRPFRDSDTEVTVHWYVVPKSNGTLPYPSRINSLDWVDLGIARGPVGEQTGADRPFDGWGRIVPPVPTDHICGERSDFEFGGLENDVRPPLVRGLDGIPTCCREEIRGVLLGGYGLLDGPSPGGLVLEGTGMHDSELTFYSVTSTDPEEGHSLETQVPASVAVEWRSNESGFDWRLNSTAPRGTAADWILRNELEDVTWVMTGWDGLGTAPGPWTLTVGSWPGLVFVSEGV